MLGAKRWPCSDLIGCPRLLFTFTHATIRIPVPKTPCLLRTARVCGGTPCRSRAVRKQADLSRPGFFATREGLRLVWRVLEKRARVARSACRFGVGNWPMLGVKVDVEFGGGETSGTPNPLKTSLEISGANFGTNFGRNFGRTFGQHFGRTRVKFRAKFRVNFRGRFRNANFGRARSGQKTWQRRQTVLKRHAT